MYMLAAGCFFCHEALRHEIPDGGRECVDATVWKMSLNFHGGSVTKLPEEGHANTQITMDTYGHFLPNVLRDATDQIDGIVPPEDDTPEEADEDE